MQNLVRLSQLNWECIRKGLPGSAIIFSSHVQLPDKYSWVLFYSNMLNPNSHLVQVPHKLISYLQNANLPALSKIWFVQKEFCLADLFFFELSRRNLHCGAHNSRMLFWLCVAEFNMCGCQVSWSAMGEVFWTLSLVAMCQSCVRRAEGQFAIWCWLLIKGNTSPQLNSANIKKKNGSKSVVMFATAARMRGVHMTDMKFPAMIEIWTRNRITKKSLVGAHHKLLWGFIRWAGIMSHWNFQEYIMLLLVGHFFSRALLLQEATLLVTLRCHLSGCLSMPGPLPPNWEMWFLGSLGKF